VQFIQSAFSVNINSVFFWPEQDFLIQSIERNILAFVERIQKLQIFAANFRKEKSTVNSITFHKNIFKPKFYCPTINFPTSPEFFSLQVPVSLQIQKPFSQQTNQYFPLKVFRFFFFKNNIFADFYTSVKHEITQLIFNPIFFNFNNTIAFYGEPIFFSKSENVFVFQNKKE
jgi:hypothetical protein